MNYVVNPDILHITLTDNIMRHLPLKINNTKTHITSKIFDYEHIHDYSHIWYVLSGELLITTRDKTFSLTAGKCMFLSPFTPHSLKTNDTCERIHVIQLSFHDSLLTRRGYDFFSYYPGFVHFEKSTIPFFFDFKDDSTAADEIILSIVAEFNKHKDMSFDTLAEMLASFFRILCREASPAEARKLRYMKRYSKAIMKAIDYINLHRAEKLTIDKLCEASGMTRRLFTKRFAEITGLSCSKFIFNLRLTNALHYLAHTTKTAGQISEEVGFVTNARLTHIFRENIGITPGEYRKLFPQGLEDDLTYWKKWSWFREKDFEKLDIF